jgi:hypothetical protein
LWKSGGEFGVGNVCEDVGNITFNRVVRVCVCEGGGSEMFVRMWEI